MPDKCSHRNMATILDTQGMVDCTKSCNGTMWSLKVTCEDCGVIILKAGDDGHHCCKYGSGPYTIPWPDGHPDDGDLASSSEDS